LFFTNYSFEGKVWCEYHKIGFDVLENQTILYCTNLLLLLVQDNEIRDDLLQINNTLMNQDVSLKGIQSYQLESLNLHRLNEHYETGLQLCKYILDDIWYQEFSIYEEMASLTWLHDMNDLFEKFVTRLLQEEYESEFEILPQKHLPNILERIEGEDPPIMKPDNLIRKNGENRVILDTKYKKDGASSSDYYQATSYSLKMGCDTVLLVPEVNQKIENKYKISGEELHVYTNSIKFPDEKNEDVINILREQILDIVNPLLGNSSSTY